MNRWLDLCLQVFQDRHLCCLKGANVFLNPFFKWSCPDRWTEDKARLVAWPSPKSSVCSPYAARRGSCYMMCGSLHSFLVERWHWTGKDGERALGAKYWGLHTLQNRPIYSIKMWYLISYAPVCVLIWRKYKYSCLLSNALRAQPFVAASSLIVEQPLI